MNELIIYTLVLAISETVAMTFITKYSKTYNFAYIIAACILYGLLVPYIILISLNYNGIGTVNLLWNIITTVSMIFIGYYLFNEKINNLHFISLFLGVSSIVVLYLAEEK